MTPRKSPVEITKPTFFKDKLLNSSLILFAGMMAGNVFNYLFQIAMGRMLSVQTFGEMNALFSMMMLFGVPFASITNYLAKNISHCCAVGGDRMANKLIIRSYIGLFVIGGIIALIVTPFSGLIRDSLKIESIVPILLLILSIIIALIVPVNTGILQGIQKFKPLSFFFAGSGAFKLVLCVALVAAGMGLNGIMIGTILATVAIGYVSYRPIGKHLRKGKDSLGHGQVDSLLFVFHIFLANFAFAIFTQSDVILVKYFFTPQEAGIYSSASVLGKTVIYFPGAIVIALFPMVASNKARNEGTLKLILQALAITLLISGSGAILFYLYPDIIVPVFFGGKFNAAIPVVGLYAVAMLPMAIVMIIMNYNIAKGGKYFVYIMLLCALFQLVGMKMYHESFSSILKVILFTGLSCALLMFLLLTFEFYKDKISKIFFKRSGR